VGVRIPDEYLASMALYRELRNEPADRSASKALARLPSEASPPGVIGTGLQGLQGLVVGTADSEHSLDWNYTLSSEEENVLTALLNDAPVAFTPNYAPFYSGERVGYVLSRNEYGDIIAHEYHPHKYRRLMGGLSRILIAPRRDFSKNATIAG
jgi:hypothetical protein